MKKLNFLIYTFICIIIFPMSISADSIEYTLFDSVMNVNIDRTIDINETYNLYFIEDTKQITRSLSKELIEVKPDKTNNLINSKIDSISSDNSFEVDEKAKSIDIKIKIDGYQDEVGEANASYKFNLGKDTSNQYDILYYDIVSNMDASISNLTFKIYMPKGYDSSKVKFLIDGKYNLTSDDLEVSYEDNQITGTLNKLLEIGQTFSVRIELEDGYFVGASDNFNYLTFLLLIAPIISLLIITFFWIKYGKGNKLNLTKLDTVPNNFDPAEIGYLFKGDCDERDLVSILLYLANEGYLRIEEHDDGYKLGKENSFKFVKLKDYEKNNAAQKIIFEHLFRDGDVAELENIEYHFADKFMEAKHMLENEDNYNKMFFKDIKIKKIISLILIALSVLIINFVPFSGKYIFVPIISILMIIGLYALFIANTTKLIKFIFGFGLLAGSIYFGVSQILLQDKLLIIYIVGIAIIILMTIIYTHLPLRTKFGNKVLGETYGLKQYLEMMPSSKLKAKLEENPNFFFDMVPYAAVLDSLEVWISKGKGIIENPPEWYIPSEEFNLLKFEKFIKNVLYTTAMVMLKKSYSQLGVDVEYSQDKVKTNLND